MTQYRYKQAIPLYVWFDFKAQLLSSTHLMMNSSMTKFSKKRIESISIITKPAIFTLALGQSSNII